MAMGAFAQTFQDVKIYINPGHGGFDGANDRNIVTIPFEADDENGFWESSSNLTKGLELQRRLEAAGATVYMSRTTNTDADDRALSEIAEEANSTESDLFMSIHSNASGTTNIVNYLLLIYKGETANPADPTSKAMAQMAWDHMIDNKLSWWSHYTTSQNCVGDMSYYGYHLGVLKTNNIPGFLSEGSFHDYTPEAHRLLNEDYRKLEAYRLFNFCCEYFEAGNSDKGVVAGFAKDEFVKFSHERFRPKAGTFDELKPVHGAKVVLKNTDGEFVAETTTDDNYNGVFAFFDVDPGKYIVEITAEGYATKEEVVEVEASKIGYVNSLMLNNDITPEVETFYPEASQDAGLVVQEQYTLTDPVEQANHCLDGTAKHIYHGGVLYALTADARIKVYKSMSTTAADYELSIADKNISDFSVTADGKIIAYALGADNAVQLYQWPHPSLDPRVVAETTLESANIEPKMTIVGGSWDYEAYIPFWANDVLNFKAVRINKGEVTTRDVTTTIPTSNISVLINPLRENMLFVDSDVAAPIYIGNKSVAEESEIAQDEKTERVSQFFKYGNHIFAVTSNASNEVLLQSIEENRFVNHSNAIASTQPLTHATATVNNYDIKLYLVDADKHICTVQTSEQAVVARTQASGMTATDLGESGDYEFNMTLNEFCNEVVVYFYKADTNEVVHKVTFNDVEPGDFSFTVAKESLPTGTMTWGVETHGENIIQPVEFMDRSNLNYSFYNPQGVAIDNNPNSPHFGSVYVSESKGGYSTGTGRKMTDGIYILDGALQNKYEQGDAAFGGNVAWADGSSPMRVSVAENGDLYITDWSDANAGVWRMDPANPEADFFEVFGGERASSGLKSHNGTAIGGSTSHCAVLGTGEDTRLYTFDEDYLDSEATAAGNILQYNIGEQTEPWTTAPSAIAFNNAKNGKYHLNMNDCIVPDQKGGWWISQLRYEDAAGIPSLVHINAEGVMDFNSGNTPELVGDSRGAGLAINATGDRLAMGCNNAVKIFDIEEVDGKTSLKRMFVISPAIGSNTNGVAFDYVGNVYAVSNNAELLTGWSLPCKSNTYLVMAPESQTITNVATGMSEVNAAISLSKVGKNRYQVSGMKGETAIQVFDTRGQKVFEQMSSDRTVVDLNTLNAGLYIIQANNVTEKVVVE